jgi:hypothetical protein
VAAFFKSGERALKIGRAERERWCGRAEREIRWRPVVRGEWWWWWSARSFSDEYEGVVVVVRSHGS